MSFLPVKDCVKPATLLDLEVVGDRIANNEIDTAIEKIQDKLSQRKMKEKKMGVTK